MYRPFKMEEKEFRNLLDKYFNGTLSDEEARNLQEFDDTLLEKNKSSVFKNQTHRQAIKKTIKKEVNKLQTSKKRFYYLGIAASVTLLIALSVIGYQYQSSPKETVTVEVAQVIKTTDWGQKSSITLSDGTKIKLNSGSTLKFPEKFNDSTRMVELSGEAFFEVTKNPDKPFIIKSGELTTTVLGTSFNVAAYEENKNISVTVATGSVQVAATPKTKAILKPEQQAIFSKTSDSIFTKKVDIELFLEWKDGIIRFENTSLKEAVEKLERWFNVKITFENEDASKCRFTGKFNKESLEVILKSLSKIHKGLNYEFTSDNEILIKGKCTN